MTTVRLIKNDGNIVGFEVSDHSGYAESGSDIVCAAVSSAVSFAETLINDSFKAGADVEVNPDKASVKLRLTKSCERCQGVLEAFERHMRAISEEYPKYIKILEVQSNA
ncbi:MAG: ribosomal-processing cysteine protease Prp [Oscillospiraceae bacterium]|nr:ribosomal-processing cysteine protease Prp [Oscillospiraceae bacterium]MBQ6901878.1 ribosomal-processing cysteine protease Prp [Oscillospiraceae bacterium]